MGNEIRAKKITSLPELIIPSNEQQIGDGKYNLMDWINTGLYLLLAHNGDEEEKKKNFKLELNILLQYIINYLFDPNNEQNIDNRIKNFIQELLNTDTDYATKTDIENIYALIRSYHPDGVLYSIIYNIDDNIRLLEFKTTIGSTETVTIKYEIKSDNYKIDEENMSITNVSMYELNKDLNIISLSNPYDNVTVTLRTNKLDSLFAVLQTNSELINIFGDDIDFSRRDWPISVSNSRTQVFFDTTSFNSYKYSENEIFSKFDSSNPILKQTDNNGYYTIIISKKYVDMDASTLFAAEGRFEHMKLIFKDTLGNKYELFSSEAAKFGTPSSNVHIDFDRPYGAFTYKLFKDNNNYYPEDDNSFIIIRFNTAVYKDLYFYKIN